MEEIETKLLLERIVEELASIEHERWAHWQQYLHGRGIRQPDGSLLLSSELVGQWEAQIATPYADLSEDEKQSDREQVHRYLPRIVAEIRRQWAE